MKISASVIVYNEEENIAELCKTLFWCDEIVIVDSFSTDKTVDIAQGYNVRIFQHEFKGYKDKHEFADSQTTGDWIFWIDADERVSPELLQSIQELRGANESELPDGFQIARRTFYLDRWIKYSGWYPDYQMRFYRKSASYWEGVSPHEIAKVNGRIEKLQGEFLHYTKKNLSEHHRVLDSYSSLAADYLHKKGKKVGGIQLFLNSFSAFIRTYILKQGFRDGIPGLIIAFMTSYGVFLKYAKLWEKNNLSE